MKKVITKALLKKEIAKSRKSIYAAAAFAGIFCLVCILMIPNKLVGVGISAFVLLFAGGLYLKYRSAGGAADLSRAYLRLLPVAGKRFVEHEERDDDGTYSSHEYLLDFGDNLTVGVDRGKFEKASEGEMYYVVFSAVSDGPIACFSAAEHEPGPDYPVVQ